MALLIQNGTVVTADKTFAADVLIEGRRDQRSPRRAFQPSPADEVLDAAGMLLLPGGIDAHTHLDMPFGGTTSSDDFETGTRAAAIRRHHHHRRLRHPGARHEDARRAGHLVEKGRRRRPASITGCT